MRRPRLVVLAGLGVLVIVAIVVGIRIHSSGRSAATVTTAPPPSSAVHTPPVGADMPVVPIGDTIPDPVGGTVRVVQYTDHYDSGNIHDTPPPDGFFAAIEATVCAPADRGIDANPFDFALRLPSGAHAEEALLISGQEPQLHFTSLKPNQCVTGWVNFAVKTQPVAVLFRESRISWKVS